MKRASTTSAVLALVAMGCAGGRGASASQPSTCGVAGAPPCADTASGEDAGASEEERVAAIQLAINQLQPAIHLCWAAAGADDFRLAGDVRVLIKVGSGGRAVAEVVSDSTGDPVLIDCLQNILQGYVWAPPLVGEAVELPLAFSAPSGQNVIDRRLVPRRSQRGAEIGVLLDARNTGNAAVSLLEVVMSPGSELPLAAADRAEIWYALGPVELRGGSGPSTTLAAGDAAYLAPGAPRGVANRGTAPATIVVLAVPGGVEGVARAGAMPAVTAAGPPAKAMGPQIRRKADAGYFPRSGGATRIYVEDAKGEKRAASLGVIEMADQVAVPPHTHPAETEVLYVLAGGGVMTVAGVEVPVTQYSAIQIPPGVEHSFRATAATTALQFYSPPGPEQRFKAMK